jgi:hypothetical protein
MMKVNSKLKVQPDVHRKFDRVCPGPDERADGVDGGRGLEGSSGKIMGSR